MSKILSSKKGAIKFVASQKTDFYTTLKRRVDQYFVDNQKTKFCNTAMITKTIVLLLAYLLPFIALLIWSPGWLLSMLLWAIMGLGLAGLGMSVMHDANHGAYSS
ncbi:MAG TPA: hypothetical protein VK616_17720, partial [Flavitalea sp.]|nr:hypothetical protein [Flavitalea sp.]